MVEIFLRPTITSMYTAAKLTLIRGLPGSGKSTLAKQLCEQMNAIHLEADMYFFNSLGDYQFDPAQLDKAHRWCRNRAFDYLNKGMHVIVSNTFVRHWEMKPYLRFAQQYGIDVEILVCHGNYGSVHGVPNETINKMRQNWQD